ncbi:ribosomal protein S18 acetylase RimI-like enzyme [Allocatelliglobosispora scoriae]|uniref:Ribosomal protein S18 acetylase RimI-like enzyme n=1 Tax=Allocatelliglobosispora scoriae TaxID=643052 RepID=A0A841BGF4_9ACTN|nr:GNAT family N-acetyltransferase [Allocatelliglobosispora scoriae]MBB5866715.1 ribosomal protein S18 acetylase RimI-like enzyme [Allocatelliglobosispora scoriae]
MSQIIGRAFQDLPVSHYLMPGTDPGERERIMTAHLGLVVAAAAEHGRLHTDPQTVAAAVWLDRTGTAEPDIPGYETMRARICGRHTDRFARFEDTMRDQHTHNTGTVGHWHLALLGVLPAHQGTGIGSALLRLHHHDLDEHRLPAYLEASTERSRALYLRHGYLACGAPYPVGPDGPLMYPLWRHPIPVAP